jgi:hypothetical protein
MSPEDQAEELADLAALEALEAGGDWASAPASYWLPPASSGEDDFEDADVPALGDVTLIVDLDLKRVPGLTPTHVLRGPAVRGGDLAEGEDGVGGGRDVIALAVSDGPTVLPGMGEDASAAAAASAAPSDEEEVSVRYFLRVDAYTAPLGAGLRSWNAREILIHRTGVNCSPVPMQRRMPPRLSLPWMLRHDQPAASASAAAAAPSTEAAAKASTAAGAAAADALIVNSEGEASAGLARLSVAPAGAAAAGPGLVSTVPVLINAPGAAVRDGAAAGARMMDPMQSAALSGTSVPDIRIESSGTVGGIELKPSLLPSESQ